MSTKETPHTEDDIIESVSDAAPKHVGTGNGKVMKFLTREQILAANDIVTEVVDVPEWGGPVIVKGLTGEERDRFEKAITFREGRNVEMNLDNFRAKLVVLSTYDNDGNRLFSGRDVEALSKKGSGPLQRVFRVAQRLSGMSDEEAEELRKGLKAGGKEDFGLD